MTQPPEEVLHFWMRNYSLIAFASGTIACIILLTWIFGAQSPVGYDVEFVVVGWAFIVATFQLFRRFW